MTLDYLLAVARAERRRADAAFNVALCVTAAIGYGLWRVIGWAA